MSKFDAWTIADLPAFDDGGHASVSSLAERNRDRHSIVPLSYTYSKGVVLPLIQAGETRTEREK